MQNNRSEKDGGRDRHSGKGKSKGQPRGGFSFRGQVGPTSLTASSDNSEGGAPLISPNLSRAFSQNSATQVNAGDAGDDSAGTNQPMQAAASSGTDMATANERAKTPGSTLNPSTKPFQPSNANYMPASAPSTTDTPATRVRYQDSNVRPDAAQPSRLTAASEQVTSIQDPQQQTKDGKSRGQVIGHALNQGNKHQNDNYRPNANPPANPSSSSLNMNIMGGSYVESPEQKKTSRLDPGVETFVPKNSTQNEHPTTAIERHVKTDGKIQTTGQIDNAMVLHNHVPETMRLDVPAPTPPEYRPFEPPVEPKFDLLKDLLQGGPVPDIRILLSDEFFPFQDRALVSRRNIQARGVVAITNIPFNTTINEIKALFSKNSRMLNDCDEGVHITMCRVTGKTLDAYVEFMTPQDAINAVEAHSLKYREGKCARLGSRPVQVNVSSEARLMEALFPSARGVSWDGSVPVFPTFNPREEWKNFKMFISEEEINMMNKRIEAPNRCQYSRDCPERQYENLISMAKKHPWFETGRYTIKQRWCIYETAEKHVVALTNALSQDIPSHRLTRQLLTRLVKAILLCPGFTYVQKDNVYAISGLHITELEQPYSDVPIKTYNMPPQPNLWSHVYTLGPKPGYPTDALEFYVGIIREETKRYVSTLSTGERQKIEAHSAESSKHFGYFWCETNYPYGPAFDNMTLAQASQLEWAALDRVLRRAVDVAQGGTGDAYKMPLDGLVVVSPQAAAGFSANNMSNVNNGTAPAALPAPTPSYSRNPYPLPATNNDMDPPPGCFPRAQYSSAPTPGHYPAPNNTHGKPLISAPAVSNALVPYGQSFTNDMTDSGNMDEYGCPAAQATNGWPGYRYGNMNAPPPANGMSAYGGFGGPQASNNNMARRDEGYPDGMPAYDPAGAPQALGNSYDQNVW